MLEFDERANKVVHASFKMRKWARMDVKYIYVTFVSHVIIYCNLDKLWNSKFMLLEILL